MRSFKSIAIFFIILSFASRAAAQDMELYIEPDKCYLGGEVRLFGFVKPDAKGSADIKVDFKKPVSGQTIIKQLKTDSNGEFELFFSETYEIGNWEVTLSKKNSNKSLKKYFLVGATVFMAPLAQDMQDFEQKTLNSVNYLLTQLASYPNFPSKDKVINDTNKLLNKFNELINVNNQLTQAVKKMEQALQSNPADIPDQAQEALRKVASVSSTTSRNIKSETAQINSLLNNIQQTTDWCNEWKLYCDLFNKLNYITNFVSNNLADIAANLLIAKQTDGMPFVKAQTIGTVCNIVGAAVTGASVIGLLNYAVGTFTSLSKAMFEELMAKFCTLFKGKVTADYHTELLHKEVPFFTMDYKLAGDVELIFQKRNPSDPEVKLEGDFKAKADDFESSITMVPFALPTSITLGFTRCPVPLIGRRTSLLYLEGNAKADELEIKLKQASYDYKLKARAYYIILGSHQPIPIPGDLEFPLMNAEWVLTRSTEISNPKKEYFILPIEIKNGKSIAEKEFNREIYLPETPNRKAVRVVMKLKMELSY